MADGGDRGRQYLWSHTTSDLACGSARTDRCRSGSIGQVNALQQLRLGTAIASGRSSSVGLDAAGEPQLGVHSTDAGLNSARHHALVEELR